MRFELQLLGDAMVAPTHEAYRAEEQPVVECLNRDLPLRTKAVRVGWWRSIAAAMSVVKAHTIEGFASSAVALHPDLLFSPAAQANDRYRAENLYRSDDSSPTQRVEGRLALRRAAMRSPTTQPREEPLAMNARINFEDVGRLELARTGLHGFRTRLLSGTVKLWSRMVVTHQNRRARDELAALDDRMLKDIGISRHEIGGVVAHGRDR